MLYEVITLSLFQGEIRGPSGKPAKGRTGRPRPPCPLPRGRQGRDHRAGLRPCALCRRLRRPRGRDHRRGRPRCRRITSYNVCYTKLLRSRFQGRPALQPVHPAPRSLRGFPHGPDAGRRRRETFGPRRLIPAACPSGADLAKPLGRHSGRFPFASYNFV